MPSTNNFVWKINGVTMPIPSTFDWGIQSVSSGESGRTDDALMHVNLVARKRKIGIGFNGADKDVCAQILQAINPEYFDVYYWDLQDGQYETRTFYVGDRSAPYRFWWIGNNRVERLSFDIIER